jgi:hypothetical protein
LLDNVVTYFCFALCAENSIVCNMKTLPITDLNSSPLHILEFFLYVNCIDDLICSAAHPRLYQSKLAIIEFLENL